MEGNSMEENHDIDKVKLIAGEWVKDDGDMWHFELDGSTKTRIIPLYDGLIFSEMVQQLMATLNIKFPISPIKLIYQFPKWLSLDERNGTTPQFIIDNSEVTIFIFLRRCLEELDPYITIKKPMLLIGTTTKQINMTYIQEQELHVVVIVEARKRNGVTVLSRSLHFCQREVGPSNELEDTTSSKGKPAIVNLEDSDEYIPNVEELRMVYRNEKTIPPSTFSLSKNHVINDGAGSSNVHRSHKTQPLMPINEVEIAEINTTNIMVWGGAEEALTRVLEDCTEDASLFMRDAPPMFNTITK